MAPAHFDIISIGGGLAGSSLARALAARGVRVLVLEREREFRDRVRGEQMQPWGCAEARALDVWDLLQPLGHHQPWIDLFLGPHQMAHRNLVETTTQHAPHFNFYHPAAQEALLSAAARAGAEVRRGVEVRHVSVNGPPSVLVGEGDRTETLTARLVVAADGRQSLARTCITAPTRSDPPFLVIAGVLLDGMDISSDTGLIYMNPEQSVGSYLFPQGGRRVRAYCAYPALRPDRISGAHQLPAFAAVSVAAGAPPSLFESVTVAGPLASFDATDRWVEHPYTQGVVLVGDAAASNDPSWGQGLSLTLRDVRVLRDALLDTDDWDAAGHAYAREHDRHYGVIHEVTLALKDMFMRSGAEASARRARALPLVAADPLRVPDHPFQGPDLPWGVDVLARFLGEE